MAPDHVRKSRERLGWTQQQAALRLGVSQRYDSQLESGSRPVPSKVFQVLQSVFQFSLELLPLPPLSPVVPALGPHEFAHRLGSLG